LLRGGDPAQLLGLTFRRGAQNPFAYGLINITTPCAGRALFDEDPTPVGPSGQYYYYHGAHPSNAVHRVAGKRLYEEALVLAAVLVRENRP
jgi:cholinesterase